MELKLFIDGSENENIKLLIELYGIETREEEKAAQRRATFNRTIWN